MLKIDAFPHILPRKHCDRMFELASPPIETLGSPAVTRVLADR